MVEAKSSGPFFLIEIDGVSLEDVEKLHLFLQKSYINPLRKMEVRLITPQIKSSTCHFSGCVTAKQLEVLKEWLQEKEVAVTIK